MKYENPARTARSAELYKKACGPIPAGVNSTARATWSGWDPYPLFVDRGEGAYLYDVDGNAYIDYLLGLGPMILGHRPTVATATIHVGRRLLQRHHGGGGNQTDRHGARFR